MWNVATSNMSLKDRLMTGNPFIARRQHPSRSVRGPDVRLGCALDLSCMPSKTGRRLEKHKNK
ncbi:unnamed protein product [Musa acuminata subsp. burmannicoides]